MTNNQLTEIKLSELITVLEKSFAGCQGHRYTEAADEYADMISALRELQQSRKLLSGIPQDAIDGGWTAKGLSDYAKRLEDELRRKNKAAGQVVGYFSYDCNDGFVTFDTAERAQKEAEDAIDYYRGDACDGWDDDVESVCWGAIIQQSTKTGERPVGPGDSVGEHISSICDYELLPELSEKSE